MLYVYEAMSITPDKVVFRYVAKFASLEALALEILRGTNKALLKVGFTSVLAQQVMQHRAGAEAGVPYHFHGGLYFLSMKDVPSRDSNDEGE